MPRNRILRPFSEAKAFFRCNPAQTSLFAYTAISGARRAETRLIIRARCYPQSAPVTTHRRLPVSTMPCRAKTASALLSPRRRRWIGRYWVGQSIIADTARPLVIRHVLKTLDMCCIAAVRGRRDGCDRGGFYRHSYRGVFLLTRWRNQLMFYKLNAQNPANCPQSHHYRYGHLAPKRFRWCCS
jgi:hypothetical protein